MSTKPAGVAATVTRCILYSVYFRTISPVVHRPQGRPVRVDHDAKKYHDQNRRSHKT